VSVVTIDEGDPLVIKEEQLTFLVENGFTVPEMSKVIGVSTRTIERRMLGLGLGSRYQVNIILNIAIFHIFLLCIFLPAFVTS